MAKFDKGDICVSVYNNKFFIGTVDRVDDEEDEVFSIVHYTNSDGRKNAGYQSHLFTLEQAQNEFRQWLEINEKIKKVYNIDLLNDIDKKLQQ